MRIWACAAAAALMAGCTPPAESPASTETATPAATEMPAQAAGAACADGSTRLAGTGLCESEASALIALDPSVRSPQMPGCTWTIGETLLPADEALLYNAATCNGVTTQLGFAGGAGSAEISYETSAMYGEAVKGRVLIRLYGTDPDPQGALKAALAQLPETERAACEIRNLPRDGWPADALFLAPTDVARAKLPADKPVVACGPQGLDETKMAYWRVRQGFAWFIDLGNAEPDFDAGNITVVAKGADGVWKAKP